MLERWTCATGICQRICKTHRDEESQNRRPDPGIDPGGFASKVMRQERHGFAA
jgi:hypothetical protein